MKLPGVKMIFKIASPFYKISCFAAGLATNPSGKGKRRRLGSAAYLHASGSFIALIARCSSPPQILP